ncbi:hypothetical protein C8F01DRAFT_321038 [Mycena amicta]|nr:hypothetical protein C8F01DRAFT_321038 [Mycena amicta]
MSGPVADAPPAPIQDPTEDNDPPPPYPAPGRVRRSSRRSRRHGPTHAQLSSAESESYEDAEETTPFLSGPGGVGVGVGRRPRSGSHLSTTSVAPSLAQTIASIFRGHMDDEEGDGACRLPEDDEEGLGSGGMVVEQQRLGGRGRGLQLQLRRYLRPLTKRVYYRALFHLYVVNFPFALAAFLFAFVFTVTGTTLLVALPLGALLCFCNLVGVRTFSRAELALQTKFHTPLAYPPPYPPRPIFIRTRESLGTGGAPVPEPSFYKNAYAMFTDATSYQALFYFIVIKPCITLVLSLALLALGLPAIVLVAPAPMAFRAIRKLGVWQANVALEGLYWVVR